MLRFFLIFLVIQGVLFTTEMLQPVQNLVVIPFTEGVAAVSAWLVLLFDPNVVSEGIVLRDVTNGFAVAIQAGCNGVEATIVLVAAMLAFPSPWKHKLGGILIGFLLVQALNLGQWNMQVFEWMHLYLWQALIMLDVLIIFLVWLRYLPRPAREGETSRAP